MQRAIVLSAETALVKKAGGVFATVSVDGTATLSPNAPIWSLKTTRPGRMKMRSSARPARRSTPASSRLARFTVA
jgi:hypothetical protein